MAHSAEGAITYHSGNERLADVASANETAAWPDGKEYGSNVSSWRTERGEIVESEAYGRGRSITFLMANTTPTVPISVSVMR